MPTSKPYKARAAKRSKKLAAMGDLNDVRGRLWQAIEAVTDILAADDTKPDMTLRAVHAMNQAALGYAKLVEASEFEARLAEMERRLEDRDTRI